MRSALLCLALAGCSPFQRQLVAEGVFATLTALDWGQTNGITQGCRESNPVIGACGENVSPSLYFPAVIALHVVISAVIPDAWRDVFQGISIGIEAKTAYRNAYVGHDPQVW